MKKTLKNLLGITNLENKFNQLCIDTHKATLKIKESNDILRFKMENKPKINIGFENKKIICCDIYVYSSNKSLMSFISEIENYTFKCMYGYVCFDKINKKQITLCNADIDKYLK